MTATTHESHDLQTPGRAPEIFDRILVGVDCTPQGFDACRQAVRLAGAEATLEAATVVQVAPGLADDREQLATAALTAASAILGRTAVTRKLHGLTVPQLLDEARRMQATLLAIGSHGHSRLEEIILGGVAGELLHQAPCSVLVARPSPDLEAFPRSIVVGLDGSPESELAFVIASDLAARRHSALEGLVAFGGKEIPTSSIVRRHALAQDSASPPVKALVDAAETADLVILGSRGLHGIRALGSVSERVAHQARCSVLVVRAPEKAC